MGFLSFKSPGSRSWKNRLIFFPTTPPLTPPPPPPPPHLTRSGYVIHVAIRAAGELGCLTHRIPTGANFLRPIVQYYCTGTWRDYRSNSLEKHHPTISFNPCLTSLLGILAI